MTLDDLKEANKLSERARQICSQMYFTPDNSRTAATLADLTANLSAIARDLCALGITTSLSDLKDYHMPNLIKTKHRINSELTRT